MSKERKSNRESKKIPAKTQKEKKQEKKLKKIFWQLSGHG